VLGPGRPAGPGPGTDAHGGKPASGAAPAATHRTPSTGMIPPVTRPTPHGALGPAEATRLLWRAGFGPRPGDVERLVALGLDGAVDTLLHPPAARLEGPEPTGAAGAPLDPVGRWSDGAAWWLDRMVRSDQPLVERMTLVWHDWFATSKRTVDFWAPMHRQNELFRRRGLGSFPALLRDVTRDTAMLVFLNGDQNRPGHVNENYAREVMELFTLGAGSGYGEADVRELARALTGFASDWMPPRRDIRTWFDRRRADRGTKRIFGRRGRFDWRDACQLLVEHPDHAPFVARRLWRTFVPTAPTRPTVARLARTYVGSGHQIAPVVGEILRDPVLLRGPSMIKPPAVLVAGMLRATGQAIATEHWPEVLEHAGQALLMPPNVAGWDEGRWMDSATWQGRADAVAEALEGLHDRDAESEPGTPGEAVDRAVTFWGLRAIDPRLRQVLLDFATSATTPSSRRDGLRLLLGASPEVQTA
jgi:hypothetical protein